MNKIYGLYHPTTKELRYVGKTSKLLEERLKVHLKDSLRRKTRLHKWLCSLEAPPLILLIESNPEDVDVAEKYWIAKFLEDDVNLVNGTEGGTGGAMVGEALERMKRSKTGVPRSEETKNKISENNWMKTPEAKLQKSLQMKEIWRKRSEESKNKVFMPLREGRKRSSYKTPKCLDGCECLKHMGTKCVENCGCKRHTNGGTRESILKGWETRKKNSA